LGAKPQIFPYIYLTESLQDSSILGLIRAL